MLSLRPISKKKLVSPDQGKEVMSSWYQIFKMITNVVVIFFDD